MSVGVAVEGQNATVELSGEISSDMIASERARIENALTAMSEKTRLVDLNALETFNSQVLSLCLCLLRLADQKGFEVKFVNTPSKLFDMARVGGLEFIFTVDSEQE